MRQFFKAGATPQEKLVAVNNKFGNSGVKSQQGTSRIIYDTLVIPAAGASTFKFFEDSSSRAFPLTNTGSDGNKLGVGDTMVIQSLLFTIWRNGGDTGTAWVQDAVFSANVANSLAYFNIEIANNQVVKKVTLGEANGFYSKDTDPDNGVIDLETQIVIPPLLPFTIELVLPAPLATQVPAAGLQYIQCQIIGTGGIIAPRTTF